MPHSKRELLEYCATPGAGPRRIGGVHQMHHPTSVCRFVQAGALWADWIR
jgi:hypothetical protein